MVAAVKTSTAINPLTAKFTLRLKVHVRLAKGRLPAIVEKVAFEAEKEKEDMK